MEIPVSLLDFTGELVWAEEMSRTLDEIRRYARPVVIDLGEGSKNLVLTVEQVGRDGTVLERRRILLTYGDDGQMRPNVDLLGKFLGDDQQRTG